MADLLRQAVYSRLAGYEDVNDAERLAQDPTFRLNGFGENLGARSSADFPLAVVPDGAVDARRESLWAGRAQANRELVADQLAAKAGEDRRTAGEICSLLLAFSGGTASDAASVRGGAGRIALLPIPTG